VVVAVSVVLEARPRTESIPVARHPIPHSRSVERRDARWTWLALALFVAFQVVVILQQRTGPFLDEGIYITAGLRTLEGHGLDDGYATWLSGSLAWPVVSALGYELAGLVGARLVALVAVTIGVTAALKASANLYGHRVRLMAAIFVLPWGPLLALAHLAVIDALAVCGLGLSMWALTELARRNHRGWLTLSALGFAGAVLAKYPVAFLAPPLLALLVALRGRRSLIDVSIFVLAAGALLQIFFLPLREQLSSFVTWRMANDPDFGVSLPTVALTLGLATAVPFAIAAAGVAATPRKGVALALLSGMVIFPLYHLLTGSSVSANKHVVFGALLALPLLGLALARGFERRAGGALTSVAVALFGLVGVHQMDLLDRSWPDVRPAEAYLKAHVEPGDVVLSAGHWPYLPGLYGEGRLASPWDSYDAYRIQDEGFDRSLCEVDWFVEERLGAAWPPEVLAQIQACGSFAEVHRSLSPVTNLANDFRLVDYEVTTVVWRNTTDQRS
jgi:hypothetical protein